MNVDGAEVERRLGRTVMPRFHAAWSFGSIGGAGIGVSPPASPYPCRCIPRRQCGGAG